MFEEHFEYDGLGRLTKSISESYAPGATSLQRFTATSIKRYDSQDRLRSDTQEVVTRVPDGAGGFATIDHRSDTVTHNYDVTGNRTALFAGPTGTANHFIDLRYYFDELNRIDSVVDRVADLEIHRFDYIGAGHRLQRLTNGNSTFMDIGRADYNVNRRVTEIEHCDPSSVDFHGYRYSYDKVGNQCAEEKTHLPQASQYFEYDDANRMTELSVGTSKATAQVFESFGLDGVGNWRSHFALGQLHQGNAVNEVNEYDGLFDGVAVEYDEAGNLSRYDSHRYLYDIRGRVVASGYDNNGSLTVTETYAYDAEGRRVYGEGFYSIHDREREIRRVHENSPLNSQEYVYGTGIDEVLSYTDSGDRFYLHKNRIGSTMAVTDDTGAIQEEYTYTPFGRAIVADGDPDSPFLFAGRRWDKSADLYFMRARYYSAWMGRFTARDPLGLWGDIGNWGNGYGYGNNNPFSGSDPYGLFWKEFKSFVGGAIDGGISGVTFGLVQTDVGARITGADTSSTAYQAGNITGEVLGSVAANSATGGAGAIGTVARVARTAGRVNDAVNNTQTAASVGNSVRNGTASAGQLLGAAVDLAGNGKPKVRGGGTSPRGSPGGSKKNGLESSAGDETLVRRGTDPESATRLGRQAKEAENAGYPHGVSVTSPESNGRLSRDPGDASSATRRQLEEAGFPVHDTPTRRDPDHKTVELPDPVTKDDARRFNGVFGRGRN